MKIIFLGTPEIAVPSLEYLIKKEDIEVIAVISQPDKPAGRGQCLKCCSVKCVAQENNLSVYQPTSIRKDAELIKTLKELEPDFFITFAFGQILSQEVLDIPKFGTINMHASLLPKYRGANPIQSPIVNGDKFTGISTMITEIGVDTGHVVLQKVIEITENMTTPELTEIISQLSPELIYESITGLYNGKIKPVPQNHEEATHAPKVTKEDGLLDWSEPAVNIHNKVRGLKPWPSTYTYISGCCIKIIETRLAISHPALDAGSIQSSKLLSNTGKTLNQVQGDNVVFGEIIGKINSGIGVITGDGVITVTKVQPAGKKEMDALSWFNGARLPKGSQFMPECGNVCESVCDISEDRNL